MLENLIFLNSPGNNMGEFIMDEIFVASQSITQPQVIYKPHCYYLNVSHLANGLYLIVTTNKTPLHNGNCPITDPITKMGSAHTKERYAARTGYLDW